MAYKCKICGYVFKSSDSDLCPECFTTRDDIDCKSFDKHHDHGDDYFAEENDFLKEQLKEERRSGFAIRRKREKMAKQDEKVRQAWQALLTQRATYYQNTTNPNATPNTYQYNSASVRSFPSSPSEYRMSMKNSNKKGLKLIAVIIGIIIFVNILPFIFGFILMLLPETDSDEDNYEETQTVEEDVMEFTTDLGFHRFREKDNVRVYVENPVAVGEFLNLTDLGLANSGLNITSESDTLYLDPREWTYIYMHLDFYAENGAQVESAAFLANTDEEDMIYTVTAFAETGESLSYADIIITPGVESYSLLLTLSDNTEPVVVDMTYDEIVQYTRAQDPYFSEWQENEGVLLE